MQAGLLERPAMLTAQQRAAAGGQAIEVAPLGRTAARLCTCAQRQIGAGCLGTYWP